MKPLNRDTDMVYWTKAGNKYHIEEDCQHIKGREVINNGTVKTSWEAKGISELRKTREKELERKMKMLWEIKIQVYFKKTPLLMTNLSS